jgi:hypothetical protein
MGAIGRMLVSLLIGDQLQYCRQIEYRLRQHHLQEQAYLSHAEGQREVRVQALDLIGRGQGTGRRGAQDPPLSAPAAAATGRGSDEPG